MRASQEHTTLNTKFRYCTSQQVVQETLNVVTRKLGFSLEDVGRLLDLTLLPLKVVLVNQLDRQALTIQFRCPFGFYDPLIVTGSARTCVSDLV